MKHLILCCFLLPLFIHAQTYPFHEGFEGLASTQVPPGWGGSMKVLGYHGRFDSKGLAARVSSAVELDSSITPLIGPLTSSSTFSFYYRIIDQAIYPSTPTDLDIDDQIEIMVSTDSINYQTVQLIDMNNHNASFNFVKKKVIVTQYAGNSVYFKIRCQFGTGGGYYVDFDTLVVANDPQLDVADIGDKREVSIYPNPCSSVTNLQLPLHSQQQEITVFNSLGEKLFETKTTVNSQLSTVNWANGIYFVHIGNEITRKLIVQH